MAALAKDRNTPSRLGVSISVPVKAATTIYAGSLVAKAAGGYAAPAAKAANLVILGRAEERADNSSGADGDVYVKVRRGVFRWRNSAGDGKIAVTEIGESKAYVADDQTVIKTATGSSSVGTILGVDGEGVWVETL